MFSVPAFAKRGIVTDGLVMHLDAGDGASYDGSSQTWLDLTGSSFDWYRGSGSGSDSRDPTFNGVSGAKSGSEYFSTDGADIFIPAFTTAGTLVRKLGRTDTEFTLEAWMYLSAVNSRMLLSTAFSSGDNGIYFDVGRNTTGKLELHCFPENSPSVASELIVGSTTLSTNTWHHLAFSGKPDNSATSILTVNGVQDASKVLTNSWSSGDSTRDAVMWARASDLASIQASGSRQAVMRMYDRALSAAELARNFNVERGRFGV